ncbi:hypothetical protein [Gemmobacter denitrificans]|uniref:Succinate dehydrogenase n=1 Tax=Gemmobacter denitrificans TaxID=3123040 RepID=A0ABU8BU24_9RHOB
MRAVPLLSALALLAACTGSGRPVGDSVNERLARTVVTPVLQNYMPTPQAQAATDCVIGQATPMELHNLAKDFGVRAGTLTVQNVATILRRPATAECLRARGIGPIAG